MKPIPPTENPLILRTNFSQPAAWEKICALIRKPNGIFRFRANVDFLDAPDYDSLDKKQLLSLLPQNYPHSFIVVVDQAAVEGPGFPLLIIDLSEKSGQEFRAVPAQIQSIENNLSIANMDFEEFASAVDPDGVFRGFPGG